MDINYKAVLFDFDGTLVNSEKGILNAAQKTLVELGIEDTGQITRKAFIGAPIRVSLQSTLLLEDSQVEEAASIYRRHYSNGGIYEAHVYDGVFDLLQKLNDAGVVCAVASVKNEQVVRETVTYFGLGKYLAEICGSDGSASVTGKTHIINRAVKKLGLKKADCLMVGDSDYDAIGAQEAGLDFCVALWGFGFDGIGDLKEIKYRYVAKDVGDLEGILLNRH
ncbi:MAG: HAD hydrolase-like protein [Christensenellaceae bacterium]|jgi:phosphoglycolate phosphatase